VVSIAFKLYFAIALKLGAALNGVNLFYQVVIHLRYLTCAVCSSLNSHLVIVVHKNFGMVI